MQQNTGSLSTFNLSTEPYSETRLEISKRRAETCGELGHMYEQKILTLALYRALNGRYDFMLDTNIEKVGAFDDVVFTYKESDGKHQRIYLQAKHIKGKKKEKKILYDKLLDEGNGDYALCKYFIDYVTIISNFEGIDHKYFIIYTNIDLKFESKGAKGIRVNKKSDTEYFVFTELNFSEHKSLENIFVIGSENLKKAPTFYQFSKTNQKGDDEKSRVVNLLQTKLNTIHEYVTILSKLKVTETELKSMLENFFDKLVFAVDQLDQANLGNQVKKEIKQNHPKSLTEDHVDYIFEYALRNVSQWKLKKAKPLTEKDNFFTKGENKFKNFPALYLTSIHEDELKNELNASSSPFSKKEYEEICEFITSDKKLWHISSNASWVPKLIIYQALKYENSKTFTQNWSINYSNYGNHLFSTWSELLKFTELLMGAFETMDQCLLIITSESTNPVPPETYQIVQKMVKIVSSSVSKKIVVISPENFELSKMLKQRISSFDPNKKQILVPTQPQLFFDNL